MDSGDCTIWNIITTAFSNHLIENVKCVNKLIVQYITYLLMISKSSKESNRDL